MPANTPVYSFTYPCPGETITPAGFALLAAQIDTKLGDVNQDLAAAIGRRNFDSMSFTSQQVIPAGVETVLTTTTSTYTIPVAGVWTISATVQTISPPATLNMERLRIRQNGVNRSGWTTNPGNETSYTFDAHAVMVAAAGDTVTLALLFNGTGTMTIIAGMSAKMMTRIA